MIQRLLPPGSIQHRFFRFTGMGIVVLTTELIAMSLLIYVLGMTYLPAVMISFLTIFSISYFGYRKFAFYGTQRSKLAGYLYFMLIASVGLTIISSGTYVLVEHFAANELIARVAIGCFSGLVNFCINTFFNFRVH